MTPSPPGHLTPSEDQLAIQFALDGVSLQTERTAIKKFQHTDVVENPLWAVTFGAFLVPGSLSLASHEVKRASTTLCPAMRSSLHVQRHRLLRETTDMC